MTQIENEYGNYGYTDYPRDKVILLYFYIPYKCYHIKSKLFIE